MLTQFDIGQFLERSRALDLGGIDWARAAQEPLSAGEARILRYMIDVESYTIAYLKALLNTSALEDPEIADFLPCWAYEESYHGRALERLLSEAGRPLEPSRPRSFQRPERLLEALKDLGGTAISRLFPREFVAVHMTWGAIQELTTLTGYRILASRTRNSVLGEVVRRIMRDESRHFSFYYHKANERLARSATARRLTAFLVGRFWRPVGAGIMPEAELDFLTLDLAGDVEGREEVFRVDETIARLPGMQDFRGLSRHVAEVLARQGPPPPVPLPQQPSPSGKPT